MMLRFMVRWKKYYLFLMLVVHGLGGYAQKLTVKDRESMKKIEDVAIFNESKGKSGLTDARGVVSLDAFDLTERIFFQHPSYQPVSYTKQEIKQMGFVVFLESEVYTMDEFVISAYRWEQNPKEIPNKITRIQKKEIVFNNPQTTADLLSQTSEVFVQKSQLGGGSPMIRGFATNSVLLVVDGVRMNNAIYREGNLQNVISLDANALESSEVIFGPGSVTYGSDALGGVMDFHTLKAKLSTDKKAQVTANAMTRYATANNEKTGHIDFNIGTPKWGFLSSITCSDYGDLEMGSRNHSEYQRPEYVERINGVDSVIQNSNPDLQVPTGYSQVNLMQKIRFRPSEKLDMNYAFHYSKLSDVPRYDRLIESSDGTLKNSEWFYGPQLWMMHALNVNYRKENALFDESKVTLAFQDYEESRHDRKFGKESLRQRTEQVKAYSFNLDFDKKLKRGNEIFYGTEVVYNSVKSSAHSKNIITGELSPESTRYPDGINDYTTLAAYAGYKENLSEKWTIISGIRYNYSSIYSTLNDTTFFNFPYDHISVHNSALNGSAGLVYRPDKSWQVNLNLSTGFHAPNIDDIAKVFDSEPGSVVVPNENLEPEYAYNADLGIKKEFGHIAAFSITGFYTFLTNAMVRRDFTFNGQDSILYDGEMSNVLAIVNADKAFIYGLNASAEVQLPFQINLESVINYTYGEDQDGIPLRHVAPVFGSTRLNYEQKDLQISLYADYNGEIAYEDMAPSEQEKTHIYATDKNGNPYSPSWWTLNVKASYRFKEWGILNFGIENILDIRYRPYSSGIVAAGRNFILGLRVYLK
ncbi:MAG: TonB-dependent receptor [Bacteroidales bacterium]|nr:TonB-dependent receptor [Bacteroidales bacterium]